MSKSIARPTDNRAIGVQRQRLDTRGFVPLVTVYEGKMPDGYLGLTSFEMGEIYIAEYMTHAQYVETVLHEVTHFLLEHNSAPRQRIEDSVERLCKRAARQVLDIENSERGAHAKQEHLNVCAERGA